MKRSYTLLFVLLVVIGFYLWRYQRAPAIDFARVEVTDGNDYSQPLQHILTDSSVVLFYASWCGPCLKELRTLKESINFYNERGIRFYCLTDDSQEKIDVMRNNMPPEISFLHVPSLKELGIYSIPATYFLKQQVITGKQLNAIDWRDYPEILNRF